MASILALPRAAWCEPASAEKPPAAAGPAPVWPAIVLGSAGGAGITIAVVGFVLSVDAANEGLGILDELRTAGGRCETEPSECERAQDAFDDEAAFKTMGVSGLVLGAAALTGLAIFQVASRSPPKKKVAIEPRLGPVTGVWVGWSFE